MLILLPPSEGKTVPHEGTALQLDRLSFPKLTETRRIVMDALRKVSAHEDALVLLGVGASLRGEVERNLRLDSIPAAPAGRVYSGVLYDALDYPGMDAGQQRRAEAAVVIMSALWGAVRLADPIAPYRLSMSASLPGTGRPAPLWRPVLEPELTAAAAGGLVVDCRSGTYAAAAALVPEQTTAVNVFRERAGKRTVVSHFAKHTRGELARHLVTRIGPEPENPAQLLEAARELWHAELVPHTGRKPNQLNIILTD